MQRAPAAAACLTLLAAHAAAITFPSTMRSVPAGPDAEHHLPADAFTAAEGEAELLGIRLNDVDQPDAVLVLRLHGHAVAVPVASLAAWRVRRPAASVLRFEGADYLPLNAVPGVQWKVDPASQTLVIQLPSAAFLRNDFEVLGQPRPAQALAQLGGFVNYDLRWQRDGASGTGRSTQQANGLVEAGVFNAYGSGLASGVWRSRGGPNFTRLDTNWNIDLPASISSVRLGDAISAPGAWGRSVRFGGVQWATNFAVQPGLVSFPMPSIRGEATVPSVVDLYVNSTHQLQGNVPPGAFDLPDVPVVTGQGQIRMVVRDLLGREQVIVQSYYVSPALLRPGLRDFSAEAGTVREDYGLESQHYGRAFISATDRVGITPLFTREFHAELLREQQTAGVTGIWQLMQMATASLSAAASHGPQGTGWLAAAGVDHQAADWSANLQGRVSSPGFAQLGQGAVLGGAPRSMLTAGVASTIGNGGFGVNLLQQTTWLGDRYRTLSINYGRGIGLLGYLSLFASRSVGSASGTTIGINLITVLGGDTSASVGSYRSRDRADASAGGGTRDTQQTAVQVTRNVPAGPGFGYQVQAERGSFDRASAEGTLQGERASFSAGVARAGGAESYRAGVTGAVALMPEGVYLSRRIDGSFAVVQVGDYAGVRVNRDNQFVARTDENGRAFVTGLRGFESNQIGVEAGDLPLDAQVDQLQIAVAPGMRSGVSVLFPVRRSRAASLRLVTTDGEPVPAGVPVRIEGVPRDYPVGFDGKLFLAGLGDRTRISAQWSGLRCEAQIELGPEPDDVPELGTQVCR